MAEHPIAQNRCPRCRAPIETPTVTYAADGSADYSCPLCGYHYAHRGADPMTDDPQQVAERPTACGLCGCDPAEGYAGAWNDGVETRLCHGDGPKPTCYMRWLYGERPTVLVQFAHGIQEQDG